MRTGGAAGRAGFRHLASALDNVAFLDEKPRAMRVAGGEIVAVVDLDHVAVLVMGPGVGHDAARRCENRGAGVDDEIHAFVHGEHAVERIDAPTEAGGASFLSTACSPCTKAWI